MSTEGSPAGIKIKEFTFSDRKAAQALCESNAHPLLSEPESLTAYLSRNAGLSLGAWQEDRLTGFLLGGHDGWKGSITALHSPSPEAEIRLVSEFLSRLGRQSIATAETTLNLQSQSHWEKNGQAHSTAFNVLTLSQQSTLVAPRSQGCVDCPIPELVRRPRSL